MATDAAAVIAAARAWIGTPYVHQASVKGAGCDCLGLLRGVWRGCVGPEPEAMQPYSPDWSDATGEETLYAVLKRHLGEIEIAALAAGDIALFRVVPHGPAKHCAVVGECDDPLLTSPFQGEEDSARKDKKNSPSPERGGLRRGHMLTLIHTRQNKRVSEELFSTAWRRKLAYAFRMRTDAVYSNFASSIGF